MNELDKKQDISLPEKLQNEHEPQIGDVYKSKSMSYEQFIRISGMESETLEDGHVITRCSYEEFNMFKREWEPCRWGESHRVSIDQIKNSYEYVIFQFDELLEQFDEVESGKLDLGNLEPVETTALVAKGKNDLLAMKDSHEMVLKRLSYMREMMRSKADYYVREMEKKMQPLKDAMAIMSKTVENMKYAIRVIEGYLGIGVEAITISDGERADAGTPVSVRQRILFMDEEVACIMADGQGLDHYKKDVFYEWMKDPKNRDIIVPEERCIVIMKPKRFDHHYFSDAYYNRILNEWNHHSFIVIRD